MQKYSDNQIMTRNFFYIFINGITLFFLYSQPSPFFFALFLMGLIAVNYQWGRFSR